MHTVFELLVSALLVAGALFTLIGSIGLVRLPDVFMRLHGPTKATTLGVGSVLLGALVYFTGVRGLPQVDNLLVIVFLFLTAPVAAHKIGRAGYRRGAPLYEGTICDEAKGRLPCGDDLDDPTAEARGRSTRVSPER